MKMELEGLLIDNTEDTQLSVKDAFKEIRQMAIDALTYVKRFVAGGTLMALLMLGSYQQTVGDYSWVDKAPQELVIDNGLQHPEVYSTAYYYQYDRFAQKIEQLRSLQNGWDGNGAMAPSHATLESIGLIIKALPKSVLMHCALFPANDSGVYLQGQFKKAKLSVYVQKEQMTFIAKDAERRKSGQKMVVNKENAVSLSDIVAELFV